MKAPMLTDLPYLEPQIDRHGNPRLYVRRNGRRIRIREKEGTPEFLAAYQDALAQLEGGKPAPRTRTAPRGTFGWLAAQYFGCAEFKALDGKQQTTRRLIIEHCLREPPNPNSTNEMAFLPLANLDAQAVRMLVERKSGKPGAANNRRKYLSTMFAWAVHVGLLKANPARDVRRVRYSTEGFHTWSVEEVQQFEAHHAVGTKARLAMALLLFLGARRGDVVKLGKQHYRDGKISYVPAKTAHVRKRISVKPVLPVLADIIARSPTGDLTFLVNDYGRAFTVAGFGNKMRRWCNEAGLPHCTAHGLKKAGATMCAENGATANELQALFDWTTPGQAEPYTRSADRAKLAERAARKMMEGR